MSEVLAELRNAALGYPGKVVLRGIDLSLVKGAFYGIVGPNGAGKTTLIKTLLGILKPLEGKLVTRERLRFGYVPQRETVDELYPLTVENFVMMGRYPLIGALRLPGLRDREAVHSAMRELGIDDLARKGFRSLSGGQKQRALMARAIACEPEVLVLDEPTNGLDLKAERAIMELIEGFHRRGLTVVMITHLINLVANAADVLILVNSGLEMGPREEMLRSERLSHAYGADVHIDACRGGLVITM